MREQTVDEAEGIRDPMWGGKVDISSLRGEESDDVLEGLDGLAMMDSCKRLRCL